MWICSVLFPTVLSNIIITKVTYNIEHYYDFTLCNEKRRNTWISSVLSRTVLSGTIIISHYKHLDKLSSIAYCFIEHYPKITLHDRASSIIELMKRKTKKHVDELSFIAYCFIEHYHTLSL